MGGLCAGSNQSPINLSQSSAKSCDLTCDLVFDDAYATQANVIVSDEGLILQSQTGLGSCKFNGEGYTCQSLVVNHPSHHTVENIQADAEVIAMFTNPSGKMLCVSSLVRVNPNQSNASKFFNQFVPYANPSVPYTSVTLGDWGLFMMVPPAGAYFVYSGSTVFPPCSQTTWVVFRSMINIDMNDFALLVKNVQPGSRPIQALGDRDVFYNDSEQLAGGPMPHDGKVYIRFKRPGGKKKSDVKDVQRAPLGDTADSEKSRRKNVVHEWASKQIETNGILALLDVVLLVASICLGIYYGWKTSQGTSGMYLVLLAQRLAAWLHTKIWALFQKKPIVATTSA